jgi:hypothetical protein
MGYSSENDKEHSSQRLNLIMASAACFILLMVVAAYILIMAIKHQGVNDWTGLGVFAGLLLTGLGVNAIAKANQKKFET